MKIEQQHRQHNKDTNANANNTGKTKTTKSKSLGPTNNSSNSANIDDEWNDFLMFRGESWEMPAENNSNANANVGIINNGNNNGMNNNVGMGVFIKKQEPNQKQKQSPHQFDSNDDFEDEFNNDNDNAGPHTQNQRNSSSESEEIPVCSPIYISTKTKISYLNTEIDIKKVFWDIPVMPYSNQMQGVVKKQIKFSSVTKEELAEIEACVKIESEKKTGFVETQIIEHIDNPDGRIKFKDQRKINIGLCKKDILNCRCKKKRAFFNCFVLIMRVEDEMSPPDARTFKEMHIKVFNTGKLEVPGIQNDASLQNVIDILISILKNIIGEHVDYQRNKCETVLINSNFNCGYYIDRDKLYDILKYKYRINSNYDSCSYPGIQCKFFYCVDKTSEMIQNGQQPTPASAAPASTLLTKMITTKLEDDDSKKYIEISFMVFRTGSVLIVGKCEDYVLHDIYAFIKELLRVEYSNVGSHIINHEDAVKKHVPKLRTRIIVNNITNNTNITNVNI
jgi:hypothetical protein